MDRPLLAIFSDMIEVSQRQLSAAKSLDGKALSMATARRQDLLFELEVARSEGIDEISDDAVEIARTLRRIDERLLNILESASLTFRSLLQRGSAPTYSADGRLQGA